MPIFCLLCTNGCSVDLHTGKLYDILLFKLLTRITRTHSSRLPTSPLAHRMCFVMNKLEYVRGEKMESLHNEIHVELIRIGRSFVGTHEVVYTRGQGLYRGGGACLVRSNASWVMVTLYSSCRDRQIRLKTFPSSHFVGGRYKCPLSW